MVRRHSHGLPRSSASIGSFKTSVPSNSISTGNLDGFTQPSREDEVSPKVQRILSRRNYRFTFPEFLPDPDPNFRNKLTEHLARKDMLKRREKVEIPEFYVGSIVKVVMSDPNSPSESKTTTFVGIVIDRGGTGLSAWFIVRNIVDGQGIEFLYRMYSPNIVRVEAVKLETRLDDELYYLRECAPEHSTVPHDMEVELLPEGEPVPLNDIVIPLGPRPWSRRWERYANRLKGYTYRDEQLSLLGRTKKARYGLYLNLGWQQKMIRYDLMRTYRRTIPMEEQDEIWEEVGAALEMRDREIKRAAIRRALTKSGN